MPEQVLLSLADRSNFVVTKIANRRCKVIILVHMSDSACVLFSFTNYRFRLP